MFEWETYKSVGHRFRKRRLWHTFLHPWFIKLKYRNARPYKPSGKRLLLVKTDLIGDYLLFRNLLPYYRERYADYQLTLCANLVNRTLADTLDGAYVDDVIWVNRNKFLKHKDYHFETLFDIYQRQFDLAIQPTFSPDIYADLLVAATHAEQKIGVKSYLVNQTAERAEYTRSFYTQLVNTDPQPKFEFFRNVEIAQKILKLQIPIQHPKLSLNASPLLEKPYAVVAPGASHEKKRWQSFAQVVDYLLEKKLMVVLVGAGNDKHAIRSVVSAVPSSNVKNMYNQTSVLQLAEIISGARLVVSNDSAPVHMGALQGIPTVGISSGTHAFRFNCYPPEFKRVQFVFPPPLQQKLGTPEFEVYSAEYSTHHDINSIQPERVFHAIHEVMTHGR